MTFSFFRFYMEFNKKKTKGVPKDAGGPVFFRPRGWVCAELKEIDF